MRTYIDNTYIRITLPTVDTGALKRLLLKTARKAGRLAVKIYTYPDHHPFYYREEEERFKLEHDKIRAKSPWL